MIPNCVFVVNSKVIAFLAILRYVLCHLSYTSCFVAETIDHNLGLAEPFSCVRCHTPLSLVSSFLYFFEYQCLYIRSRCCIGRSLCLGRRPAARGHFKNFLCAEDGVGRGVAPTGPFTGCWYSRDSLFKVISSFPNVLSCLCMFGVFYCVPQRPVAVCFSLTRLMYIQTAARRIARLRTDILCTAFADNGNTVIGGARNGHLFAFDHRGWQVVIALFNIFRCYVVTAF